MATDLKVFTLNSWGLPFPVVCKNRPERINAIGDYLAKGDFDVVFLQEIWVKSDFAILREKVQNALPFSHYFYSGAIGSGMCVFSKHPISYTFYHNYALNGHAHKILHGDWFGGKGIGLCKIVKDGVKFNMYTSHLHAEYNPTEDEYRAHRMAQTVEVCQFIELTSVDCDVVVLGGDLNTPADGLGYKIFTQNCGLSDAWKEKKNKVENEALGTCDLSDNTYTPANLIKTKPNGERIDYVLYAARNDTQVSVSQCTQGGLGLIPGGQVSYSDHEPVIATFKVTKSSEAKESPNLTKDKKENLQECLLVMDKGISQCLGEERFFQVLVVLLSVLLYVFTTYVNVTDPEGCWAIAFCVASTKLIMSIAVGFCVWIALIVKRAEFHGLIECREDVIKMLKV